MQSSRRSQKIQEGIYLADIGPKLSPVPSLDVHDAIERPIPIPTYDPQWSIVDVTRSTPNLSLLPAPAASKQSLKPSRLQEKSINWYRGDHRKVETHFGIPRSQHRRSRISITPSDFQIGTGIQPFSVENNRELSRIRNGGKEPLSPTTPEDPKGFNAAPPDGGTLAWLHVLAGHLVVLNAQGFNLSFGIFQAYYSSVLIPDHSPSQIAWIGSLQIFLLFCMGILVSPLVDKGLFQWVFSGGSVLMVASMVLLSFCKTYWQLFLVQGLVMGVAMGLIFSSGIIVLISYFSKNLGVATGIAASGGSMGGIIFPLIGQRMILRNGFPWTVRTMALVSLVTLVPANIIARQRPSWKPRGPPQMDWTAFRDVPYLLMMAGMFFAFWGVYFGFYYIVTFAETTLHLSPTASITLLIAMNATNLPGRFLPNLIADACIGPLNTTIPSTVLAAMLIFLWIGASSHTSITIVACFYGFAAAGLQGLYNAAILSFAGDNMNKVGIRMAMVFVVIGVACLTGTPLGGLLIRKDGGKYLSAQLFSACSILLGAMFLLAARLVKCGWRPLRV